MAKITFEQGDFFVSQKIKGVGVVLRNGLGFVSLGKSGRMECRTIPISNISDAVTVEDLSTQSVTVSFALECVKESHGL